MASKPPTPAQIKALQNSTYVFKPNAAFTNVGQKPTGLAKSTEPNRFASNAKTPVYKATDGLRGSGTPLRSSIAINPLNKGQVINAVLSATVLTRGSGQVTRSLAKASGTRVSEAAFSASTKGFGASGAGGKVSTVMTPFGKTLGSTSIGSEGVQVARMNNLTVAKAKEAVVAGKDISNQVIRGMNMAGKIVKGTVLGGVVAKNVVTKAKKK